MKASPPNEVVLRGFFWGQVYGGVNNLAGEFYGERAGFPMPLQTIDGGVQVRY